MIGYWGISYYSLDDDDDDDNVEGLVVSQDVLQYFL